MAYDADLAERVRAVIAEHGLVDEKKMFGGLAFMLGEHMAIAVSSQGGLMVRVAETDREALLEHDDVAPMEMGGRRSHTWLRVQPESFTDDDLAAWVARGVAVARALPPKT